MENHGIAVLFVSFLLLGCWGAADNLRRGDELADSRLYEEALEEYRKAAKKEPDNGEVRRRIAEVQKKMAEVDAQDGRTALDSGDRWGALAAFKRAIVKNPDDDEYRQVLKQVAQSILAEGDKALEEKRFNEALELFEKLSRELPRLKHAQRGVAQAKEGLSRQLMEEARQYKARMLYGNALISLVQLRKLSGVYGESAAMEQEARQQLRVAANFGYQVRAGKSKRKLQDGTAELVRLLLQAEVPTCPGAVLEHRDPRVVLTVALNDLAYETSKKERTGEQKYQSGTRPVDNPAFQELETKIEQTRAKLAELGESIAKTSKELDEVRQTFADAGPSDDADALRKRLKAVERQLDKLKVERRDNEDKSLALRNQLNETPPKLDEPVYDIHSYPIVDMSRTVTAVAALTARQEGNRQFANEPFSASASMDDSTCRAQPKFGVQADPLQWPRSDEALAAEAFQQLAEQIAKRLGGLCQQWRQQILERATQAASAAKAEAVEDYVLYLFLEAGPPPASLVEFLRRERGVEDIEAIRGGKPKPSAPTGEGFSI